MRRVAGRQYATAYHQFGGYLALHPDRAIRGLSQQS